MRESKKRKLKKPKQNLQAKIPQLFQTDCPGRFPAFSMKKLLLSSVEY